MEKVLVIEDDQFIRENTAELLSISKYQVLTAENGRKGYEQARLHHPDLALCDMMMPESDGRGFLKQIRNDDVLRTIPIIFFSAGTLSLEDQNSLVNEVDGFLRKPFTKEDLLRTIQHVLHKRKKV